MAYLELLPRYNDGKDCPLFFKLQQSALGSNLGAALRGRDLARPHPIQIAPNQYIEA
jgi:hypothetical protein